jgi:hypothetical protein
MILRTIDGGTTFVREPASGKILEDYYLMQDFPNPFNSAKAITFRIPSKSYVRLGIFNALGREVAVLAAEEMNAGTYTDGTPGLKRAGCISTVLKPTHTRKRRNSSC